jgi:hypothetical protein
MRWGVIERLGLGNEDRPGPDQGYRDAPGAAMTAMHRELAAGRWFELPLAEQMANIGSEIERTISWRGRNEENSKRAFDRGLELLDLTITDPRHRRRLRELVRVREALADYFVFDNLYGSTDESWRKYFHSFTYAVAIRRGH